MRKRLQPWRNRCFAALLMLALLIQAGGSFSPVQAAQVNSVTSDVSLWRWEKVSKLDRAGLFLLTWRDNGQLYYLRMGADGKYTWEGEKTRGNLVLSNNLVSAQPELEAALSLGADNFFTTDTMDAGLYAEVMSGEYILYASNQANINNSKRAEIQYENYNSRKAEGDRGGLMYPTWSGENWWYGPAYGSNGAVRIRSTTLMNDTRDPTFLRHNGNRLYASQFDADSSDAIFEGLYAIQEYRVPAIQDDYAIANGSVLPVENMIYIPKGVTLTVKSGGVLSVGGLLLNDGKIVVEKGGLVILKEGSSIMPLCRNDVNCGGIISKGGIVVRRDAKLIGGGYNGLYLTGGSLVNFGLIASENFRVTQPDSIENREGGRIYSGKTLGATHYNDLIINTADKKARPANSTIAESSFETVLYSGTVKVENGAILADGGIWANFGSFAVESAENPVVKVYSGPSGTMDMPVVVTSTKSEIGYYQSEAMHVTVREYLDGVGTLAQIRQEYLAGGGKAEDFETYFADYCKQENTDPNSMVTVYNGIFTVAGDPVYTVPWYEMMMVSQGEDILVERSYPWKVSAIWGTGARPGDAVSDFANAPLLDRTFTLEPLCAEGKHAEVAGGSKDSGANVRIWSAQEGAEHRMWTFQQGEAIYQGGEKTYYYYITNVNSGMVMTITSSTYSADGQNVRQEAKRNAPRQQLFRVERNSDGSYRIIPRGDENFALEVNNGGSANGSNIQVKAGSASDARQKWRLTPAG